MHTSTFGSREEIYRIPTVYKYKAWFTSRRVGKPQSSRRNEMARNTGRQGLHSSYCGARGLVRPGRTKLKIRFGCSSSKVKGLRDQLPWYPYKSILDLNKKGGEYSQTPIFWEGLLLPGRISIIPRLMKPINWPRHFRSKKCSWNTWECQSQ